MKSQREKERQRYAGKENVKIRKNLKQIQHQNTRNRHPSTHSTWWCVEWHVWWLFLSEVVNGKLVFPGEYGWFPTKSFTYSCSTRRGGSYDMVFVAWGWDLKSDNFGAEHSRPWLWQLWLHVLFSSPSQYSAFPRLSLLYWLLEIEFPSISIENGYIFVNMKSGRVVDKEKSFTCYLLCACVH